MARPLRIEFPGAIYHVTSRGDRREAIYQDDVDKQAQLDVIAQALDRFDAQLLAYCLMGNHYHLVLHTRQGNLSRLMRHVNGVYTQRYNRRHSVVGHLLQGRFKAILVDRDAYLLALCRYVERNPVAAGIVSDVAEWPWSSYRAHIGQCATPAWLDSDGLHGYLLGRAAETKEDRRVACKRYAQHVAHAPASDGSFWQDALQGQVFLGDKLFAERMRQLAQPTRRAASEVPREQRLQHRSWADCVAICKGNRNDALHMAYRDSGITMTRLAQLTGLSISHVSRLIDAVERNEKGKT